MKSTEKKIGQNPEGDLAVAQNPNPSVDDSLSSTYGEVVKSVNIETLNVTKTGDVSGLKESIKEAGILQLPIVDSEGNVLAGNRRIVAGKELGFKSLDVLRLPIAGPVAEMRGIESELTHEQSFLKTYELLSRWKKLYEEQYPETKKGGNKTKKTQKEIISFRHLAAKRMSCHVRNINRFLQIGDKLLPEVRTCLMHTDQVSRAEQK